MQTVFPLPDLLPRNLDEIKRLRELYKMSELIRRPVPTRRELPHPYVNDDESDEFEDKTINTQVENLSEKDCYHYTGDETHSLSSCHNRHYYYDHTNKPKVVKADNNNNNNNK